MKTQEGNKYIPPVLRNSHYSHFKKKNEELIVNMEILPLHGCLWPIIAGDKWNCLPLAIYLTRKTHGEASFRVTNQQRKMKI